MTKYYIKEKNSIDFGYDDDKNGAHCTVTWGVSMGKQQFNKIEMYDDSYVLFKSDVFKYLSSYEGSTMSMKEFETMLDGFGFESEV